ncbi:MAG: bifunctional folylpolyglutamate synthase/dihydrofolate synthase [Chloroflexi bacterium]|nr:bifunctional folylpolyglutamate synthase/dihydrofolate synthase [Chloroflexota bacterium]
MNEAEALDYLLSFADYERGTDRLAPGRFNLDLIRVLCHALADPQETFPSVHIAGTKGKGSTAAILDSILRAAGYRVGLYTSPHLHTLHERIRVNGAMISGAALAQGVDQLRAVAARIERPSTFELLTALAFLHFAQAKVDVAVVETGLGGRLDATNILNPPVAVITSISIDHSAILGDSLGQIAREKAGIIKAGSRVVVAPQSQEALEPIEEACRQMGSQLYRVGHDWRWDWQPCGESGSLLTVTGPRNAHSGLRFPLLGLHQAINATTAIASAELLAEANLVVSPQAVAEGIAQVRWPGRLEVVHHDPLVVVDGAHNADSMEKLCAALQQHFNYQRLIAVFGSSADKDVVGMARELGPRSWAVGVTRSQHPRAFSPEPLAATFAPLTQRVSQAPTSVAALEQALAIAEPGDLICVTGSLFLVAEARAYFGCLSIPQR